MPPEHDHKPDGLPQRLGVAAVWLTVIVLLGAGCSEMTRYRVLTFFFDGVPLPPSMQEPDEAGPGADALVQDGEEPEPAPLPLTIVATHEPYEERLCFDCHSGPGAYQVEGEVSSLCKRCHVEYFEYEQTDWVHGPVAAGACDLCHEPHESVHMVLLTEAQPGLCLKCHDEGLVLSRSYHAGDAVEHCSTCHDPHLAGNRLLLADSRTYARSQTMQETLPSAHADWNNEQCETCHDPNQAFAVLEGVDEVCLSCHEDVSKSPVEGRLHRPVLQGLCTTCHLPHDSPLPHLIKPAAETACYECHDAEEIDTPRHPTVTRAACLLCHAGHSSDQPHLLKSPVPAHQ